ncbi:MAG TPA: hypothetical protein VMV73_05965 [Candidatus Dormibacteraeota bacterium]|nr:hypothetical protein [Candidatus Dormibacteraeota bacterium]
MMLAVVLMSTTLSSAQSAGSGATTKPSKIIHVDGTWWAGLSSDEQILTVEALVYSYQAAFDNGFIRAAKKDVAEYHSTRTTAQLTADDAQNVSFSKTFGTYQQEITDFYSAHPGSMGVNLGDVMSCLSDDPQFSCAFVATLHN